MSIFRNPVSYCIYFILGILVVTSFGEAPLVVLQHLILPYTVDISRGVGETGAATFRGVTFLAQLLIALFILLVVKAKATGPRVVLSIFGILFVVIYFLVVAFGYIMPRFH